MSRNYRLWTRPLLALIAAVMCATAAWADKGHGTLKNGSWKITDDGTLFVNVSGALSDFDALTTKKSTAPLVRLERIDQCHQGG